MNKKIIKPLLYFMKVKGDNNLFKEKKGLEYISNFLILAQVVFVCLFVLKSTVAERPQFPSLIFFNIKICSLPQGSVQRRQCKEVGKKPQLCHHT